MKTCVLMTLLACLVEVRGVGSAGLTPLEQTEPGGVRILNQPELAGVIRNDSSNMDVTQIFTVNSSGSLSAIGVALGYPGGTPWLTVSLHRLHQGTIQHPPVAASTLPSEYFSNIGPQTVPLWVYAEFFPGVPVTAGEQIGFRVQSPFAQLWGPRSDVLAGAELIEIPGTDLAFRVYLAPPSLTALNIGTNLVLRWPVSMKNGAVESSPSLSVPLWSTNHMITSATNEYVVNINQGSRFFRLRVQ
jgi:hypothetical protein